jgi:hypothetical protein
VSDIHNIIGCSTIVPVLFNLRQIYVVRVFSVGVLMIVETIFTTQYDQSKQDNVA